MDSGTTRSRWTATQHAGFGYRWDVVHNTTIHNDPTVVLEAVITALQRMGMLGQVVEQAPPASSKIELPATLEIGERVFVNWKNYGHYYAER